MNNVPKVIDLVVNNDFCIGCGLCTYQCPTKALEMKWNEDGFLVPALSGTCDNGGSCLDVCPFNPYPKKEVQTENELADIFLHGTTTNYPKVGKYVGIYAGHADEYRMSSSSGGIATYVLVDLLEKGIVNHVFTVKESDVPDVHYDYTISNNKQELLASSKTKYYPVTLSGVFSKIEELDGKIAIVGVACFVKAIRLAQYSNPSLKEKIPFLVGIICGGIKSKFFTEYLSDKAGVKKVHCTKPEFRIKNANSTASDYSFGCNNNLNDEKKSIKMRTVGDMWGTGLFKANACDLCDDVTAELADISLGDAWLQPFVKDGKGANVVITRTSMADKIIKEGITSEKLNLDTLSLEKLLSSQQGSYNHRHTGMPYRIKRMRKKGKLIPPKRFEKNGLLAFDFKIVQFFRMKIRKKCLDVWKDSLDARVFDKKMKKNLKTLKLLTRFNHFRKALQSKLLRIRADR
jgi:coenzyme F420-reducing hydrogenase beta subunit